jgi:hypothetical protein
VGDYCPMISTGEIPEGSWGNFPSGETFTLPNSYKASGTVTLRGSYPNRPLTDQEWVRFSLRRGRIKRRSTSASSELLGLDFSSYFFAPNGRPRSVNANALAELGVGTNRRIARLTGRPIFDEKKLDTVHIAFGSNTQFNGPLASRTHHDLTCTGSSLFADDIPIVMNGEYVLKSKESIKSLDKFDAPIDLNFDVMLGSSVLAELASSGEEFVITYTPYRGDNVAFVLACGDLAREVQAVIEEISTFRRISLPVLKALLGAKAKYFESIVSGLLEYRVIERRT